MKHYCLCGNIVDSEEFLINNHKCCDFIIRKYANLRSDFILKLNKYHYEFDNSSLCLYTYIGYTNIDIFHLQIKLIDETLSLKEIREEVFKIVQNICFM